MLESEVISEVKVIDALEKNNPLSYQQLNVLIRKAVKQEFRNIKLLNIYGQRFIAAGVECEKPGFIQLEINGIPGNDLGIFLNGPKIVVNGNAEDQVGNTMNEGTIIIHGDCRDVAGLSMRGGKIYVKGNAGYRVGIHMKEYQSKIPVVMIGGSAREFFGEYMAGGMLVALGLKIEEGKISKVKNVVGPSLGSGIHGGTIYLRGDVPESYLGIGTIKRQISEEDHKNLEPYISEFCNLFKIDSDDVWNEPFIKIFPGSHRPYAAYYTAKPI